MITLINLGTGLSYYEYGMTCKNGYVLSVVLCTMYYLLYMATVVLLLMNLLIGALMDCRLARNACVQMLDALAL